VSMPNSSRAVRLLVAAAFAFLLVGAYAASAAQGDCAQPVSMGAGPVASDCLFLLNVAVGLQTCTPQPCVCDPTGDGNATASDALVCLRKAVGDSVALACPCATTTTTTVPVVPADCTNDGNCSNDDCVCPDCDDDLFCSDPSNCMDNGVCRLFNEGCVCVDCMTRPECLDNN